MSPEAFEFYLAPANAPAPAWAKTDIWALGVLAVEVASGMTPTVMARSSAEVDALIAAVPRPPFSDAFSGLIARTLRIDAAQRPTAVDLLQEPICVPHAMLLTGHAPGASVPSLQESLERLQRFGDAAAWAAPLRVAGRLPWVEEAGPGESHRVRLCDCGALTAATPADTPSRRAAREIMRLVEGVAGNGDFGARFDAAKVVLVSCRVRTCSFAAKVLGLNNMYRDRALFSLDGSMSNGPPGLVAARRKALAHFKETYPSLCAPSDNLENVRVWLAFAAVPTEEIARKVHGSIAYYAVLCLCSALLPSDMLCYAVQCYARC